MSSSTRQKLIEAANQRFYRDGFRNVGIDQILDDVGISKTAFYKHFESKDDLVLEVLAFHDRWWRTVFQDTIRQRGGSDPVAQLRAMLDVVEDVIESDDYRGCFFVNVAMEFPLSHDPAHRAAAENKRAIEGVVRELATRAGVEDPQAMAEELCLVMEGAYVTHQVTGSPATGAIARRVADHILRHHIPDAGGQPS